MADNTLAHRAQNATRTETMHLPPTAAPTNHGKTLAAWFTTYAVVITFEGEEFRSHRPAKAILAALERSRAELHVVAVGKPTLRRMARAPTEGVQGDEWAVDEQNRNAVLGDGPRQSGGRRHEIAVATGLTRALEDVADDLLNQYTVVYDGATEAKPRRVQR